MRVAPIDFGRALRPAGYGVELALTTSSAVSIIAASRLASGSSATGGVSTITQSNCSTASMSSCFIVSDTRLLIGSGVGTAGRQDPEPRHHLVHGQSAALRAAQAVAQADAIRQLKHLVDARAAQVGVDQQHAALVRLAEGEREVGRRQRLAFGRDGARNHHAAIALLQPARDAAPRPDDGIARRARDRPRGRPRLCRSASQAESVCRDVLDRGGGGAAVVVPAAPRRRRHRNRAARHGRRLGRWASAYRPAPGPARVSAPIRARSRASLSRVIVELPQKNEKRRRRVNSLNIGVNRSSASAAASLAASFDTSGRRSTEAVAATGGAGRRA